MSSLYNTEYCRLTSKHASQDIVMSEALPTTTLPESPDTMEFEYDDDLTAYDARFPNPVPPRRLAVAPVLKLYELGKRLDILKALPYELAAYIVSFLDVRTVVRMSAVSRHWRALSRDNAYWRQRMAEMNWRLQLSRQLDNHDDDRIEWHYFYKQKYQLEQRWNLGRVVSHNLIGHKSSVYCVQFDDRKLVTGSRDWTIKVWDLSTYQCRATLEGHRGSVLCLKYNDHIMVSGSSDTTVIVWSMYHLQKIRRLKGHTAGISDVCFDERYIISSSKDGTIKIWDLGSGAFVRDLTGHQGPVNAIQLHGDYLVSASGDTTIKMWNVTTGMCIRTFFGHSHGIACVRYDGHRIVSGSNDQTIKIWDPESGRCTATLEGHEDLVRALDLDGDKIVSASYDKSIRVWDIKRNICLVDFQSGHQSRIYGVRCDKKRIVSVGQDHKILVMDFAYGLDTRFIV